jgi:hypothetical protein
MRLHRFWLILSGLILSTLFAGCFSDRVAGTEVGNPELTVSARFGVENTGDSMTVTGMNLKCMGMTYHSENDSDSTGTLWGIPEGYMVSMMDMYSDSAALRTVTIRSGAWNRAEMVMKMPVGDSTLPGAVNSGGAPFSAFSNPRYVKFSKRIKGVDHRFLFDLAGDASIKLMYGKAHIGTWIHKDSLAVEIMFDAGKWAAGLALDASAQIRKDQAGTDYLLLSSSENAKIYNPLKALLPNSFMADSTDLR